MANWTGQRIDSKDAYVAGDEYIAWLERHGRDPRQKRLIASDALDVEQILGLHAYFAGTLLNGASPDDFRSASDFHDRDRWIPDRRIRFSAGWGTLLTNDFRNCNPQGDDGFNPVGLVCKLSEVDGRPAVKLSDNYSKALGDPDRSRALPPRLRRRRRCRRARADVMSFMVSYAASFGRSSCLRNRSYARGRAHVESYGSAPVIVYEPENGRHGNFFDPAYTAIAANSRLAAPL